MSKITSTVEFQHFLIELWVFESGDLLKNQIRVLKVQEIGALSKLANALSKLVVVVIKVVGYTNYELIHD